MLINNQEFNSKKSKELIPLECENCHNIFYKLKCSVKMGIKKTSGHVCRFCSLECFGKYKTLTQTTLVKCVQCGNEHRKPNNVIKKSKNNFCNHSCSTQYQNSHKTTGYRRSKLEKWLEEQLTKLYPTLEIHFNKTDIINSELDIYIPSLKLAFELNGIFHYEPIYGNAKLHKTQNNDQRKFQACIERGIALCIIDTSKQIYFKESTSKQFLNIITQIIDNA